MDDDRKFEISSAVGTTVFFISCIGISSYEEAVHEGYESIHEKLPMETIFASSLATGIVLAIITWLIVTFGDCLKRAKEKDELTTWGLFKKEVFSKNTLLALIVLIVVSVLIAFLGILFIGLAIFFLPLLKGKFKWWQDYYSAIIIFVITSIFSYSPGTVKLIHFNCGKNSW